jgi:hypothetical protein
MTVTPIAQIVEEINRRAANFAIGDLQNIRSRLTGHQRVARTIFDRRTIFDHYAFHVGGRTELQFNIGFEKVSGFEQIRYGVAFSLELNRNLPRIDPLLPKMKRFGEFLCLDLYLYADLRMWHWQENKISSDYVPGPIPEERAVGGIFIFLGRRQPANQIDYDSILTVFDRLLPLYEYVQGGSASQSVTLSGIKFAFRSGCPVRSMWARASRAQRELDIRLRHNELQVALHRRLVERHGADNVGVEN